MKSIMYIFGILLFSSIAMAIPAGTVSDIYEFNKCDSLRVDVTGTLHINDSEYTLLNCEQTTKNSWYCDCTDDYTLRLNTSLQTINNYTFSIQHNYSVEREEDKDSSSGGSSGGYYYNVKNEETERVVIYSSRDITLLDERHEIVYNGNTNGIYYFTIYSNPINFSLQKGENKSLYINNETYLVTLVRANSYSATLDIEHIKEEKITSEDVKQNTEDKKPLNITDNNITDSNINDTIPNINITNNNEEIKDIQNTINKTINITSENDEKSWVHHTGISLVVLGIIILLIYFVKYGGKKK